MAGPAIMAYVGPDTNVVSVTGVAPLADWANNQVYWLKEGSGATDGIRQFLEGLPGTESLDRTRVQIGSLAFIQSGAGGAQVISFNGMILFLSSASSNSAVIGCVRASDLVFIANFGVSSGSLSPSDGTRILLPYSFAPLRFGGGGGFADFVISCASVGVPAGEVCVLAVNGVTVTNTLAGNLDEPLGVAGRGAIGSTSGTVFIVGKEKTYGVGLTTPFGLYVLTKTALTTNLTKLGTVSPAQVDATWTKFSGVTGVAYDQVDGNPIVQVFTAEAVANQVYFVKLNKTNAAVLWTCAVNFQDAFADNNLGRHNITAQVLYYMGSGNRLYTINTNTGVATNAVIGTLAISGGQVSEDIFGSLFGYGSWNEGATHPSYIGDYMGVQGNHTLANKWSRWLPNGLAAPSGANRRWLAESGPVRV